MGLEPTSRRATTCFQDRLLIRPDDFRPRAAGGWNRTNIKAFRAPRPTVRRPRINHSRHARLEKARGVGVEPTLPGSKPGGLPLADPRSEGVPCGSRTRLASLEDWNLCRSVKGTSLVEAEGEGVEPSRLLRSTAFEAAAIADWLALPSERLRWQESNLRPGG